MDGGRRDDSRANLLRLGRRVKSLRQGLDMSQEQLAHTAGLHRAVVGFVERGERDIGVSQLWPLAEALGVEVADLFRAGQ